MIGRRGFFGLLLGAVGASVVAKNLAAPERVTLDNFEGIIDEPYLSNVWSTQSEVEGYMRQQIASAKRLDLPILWGRNP